MITPLGRNVYMRSELARLSSEALVAKIGEAANRLPRDYRDAHPEVPWKQIRGLRNIVTHAYGQMDHGLIWNALTKSLPRDVATVRALREEW